MSFLCYQLNKITSMKLVILLHSLYWSIHSKDESKRGTIFALIFKVKLACCSSLPWSVWKQTRNWCHSIVWSLFSLKKSNGMTSFMQFMLIADFLVTDTLDYRIIQLQNLCTSNYMSCFNCSYTCNLKLVYAKLICLKTFSKYNHI